MTIFALASGAGRAAIAIVRISGPQTAEILTSLCKSLPQPRRATLRTLLHQRDVLDHALVLWFPGQHSYTGEDSAELQLHGGRAVIEAVIGALGRLGARPAEPGEFTRRAFLNNRVDLLQAEAVVDLVAAETEGQRRQALRQLSGALGGLYRQWADDLRRILAWQEAQIDFSTEDLPDHIEQSVLSDIGRLIDAMGTHLRDGARGERLRDGLLFAISGPPNVGKSSLLNALAERDVAIVSPRPGTTRDAIEIRLDLAGVPVTLIDTAGIRESDDEIEQEGVRRALNQRASADLVIELREPGAPVPATGLAVLNKIDLLAPAWQKAGPDYLVQAEPRAWLPISVRTGQGLPDLRNRLAQEAINLAGLHASPVFTRTRHRAAIEEARTALSDAAAAPYVDQRAEELRLAMRALGRITGEVQVEDLLETVFSTFCIGK